MPKRTDEEIRSIIARCLKIEKEGGDILGYLRTEHYISPGATWWNFQRTILGRKESRMTSGKPKEKPAAKAEGIKDKEEKHMESKGALLRKDFESTAKTALNIVLSGYSPMKFLKAKGYAYPAQSWKRIKEWCQRTDPETFDKLPKNLKSLKQPSTAGAGVEMVKRKERPEEAIVIKEPVEHPAEEPKIVYQDEIHAWNDRPAVSPTCCQPARGPAVSVPDTPEIPNPAADNDLMEYAKRLRVLENKLKVSGVSSKQGTWSVKRINGKTYVEFQQAMSSSLGLCMEPGDWITFAYDSIAAVAKLGVWKDENTGD